MHKNSYINLELDFRIWDEVDIFSILFISDVWYFNSKKYALSKYKINNNNNKFRCM